MAANPFLTVDRKIRSIWWVVIFFLILSLFLFPLIFIADYFSFEITMLHQIGMIILASGICQLLIREPISDLTGNINLVWFKQLLMGLFIGAVLMILPALLLSLFGYIHWKVNSISISILFTGMGSILLAAIAEELLFRGFIFQRFIKAFGMWPAQIIIAGLFLLTHLNNPGMTGTIKVLASINIFVASILFGMAFTKTKSMAMPIGLHFMANFMQGTILGFGVSGGKEPSVFQPLFDNAPVWISGGEFGIEASIFGLIILLVITLLLYFWNPTKSKMAS